MGSQPYNKRDSVERAARSCRSPFIIKKAGTIYKGSVLLQDIKANCGRCVYCIKRRVNDWAFRIYQQDKISTSSAFITLTYDTEHVPITNKGFMTLSKQHVQLFMKRLRENDKNKTIKYYLVGEYGTQKMRPHYHILLFNVNDYANIEKSWNKGEVHYGQVQTGSIKYVLKYIDKNLHKSMTKKYDDRIKEFCLMSKNLGSNYLSESIINYHHADLSRNYVVKDEHKIALPKYYKKKLFNEEQNAHILRLTQVDKEELKQFNLHQFANENEYNEEIDRFQAYFEQKYKLRKDNIN